ncbi:MAG: biotin/lipoyl-binding protein [Clostridia bacterium]|nr:biotin/lipoyl-binding protein [Clostridia bacterium]
MRRFRVNVNGNEYDITLEEIDANAAKTAPAPKKADAAPVSAPAGGEQVKSPMPGTILKVNVTNGASVKKGDVLMVLEAMKMENEIMCPCDGKVASVNVAQGASVESGTVLCSIA